MEASGSMTEWFSTESGKRASRCERLITVLIKGIVSDRCNWWLGRKEPSSVTGLRWVSMGERAAYAAVGLSTKVIGSKILNTVFSKKTSGLCKLNSQLNWVSKENLAKNMVNLLRSNSNTQQIIHLLASSPTNIETGLWESALTKSHATIQRTHSIKKVKWAS